MKWNWRDVLCWGLLLCYFTMPMAFFAVAFSGQQGWIKWDPKGFPYLRDFFNSVTALIFGLAGLNSFDRYSAAKLNGNKPSGMDAR